MNITPREAEAPDALPFALSGKAREGLAGTRHVRQVDDGWLVGFDAGEYGGALWWFSPDGARRAKLLDGNVVAIDALRTGIVVLTGLAHLGISEGKAYKLARSEGPNAGDAAAWRAAPWLDFGAAAEAAARESDETMLVLTVSALLRVTACGDVTQLATPNYDVLYPSSMTVDADGVVTIGMRQYVTRLLPNGDGSFTEQWLAPSGCAVTKTQKFECTCVE